MDTMKKRAQRPVSMDLSIISEEDLANIDDEVLSPLSGPLLKAKLKSRSRSFSEIDSENVELRDLQELPEGGGHETNSLSTWYLKYEGLSKELVVNGRNEGEMEEEEESESTGEEFVDALSESLESMDEVDGGNVKKFFSHRLSMKSVKKKHKPRRTNSLPPNTSFSSEAEDPQDSKISIFSTTSEVATDPSSAVLTRISPLSESSALPVTLGLESSSETPPSRQKSVLPETSGASPLSKGSILTEIFGYSTSSNASPSGQGSALPLNLGFGASSESPPSVQDPILEVALGSSSSESDDPTETRRPTSLGLTQSNPNSPALLKTRKSYQRFPSQNDVGDTKFMDGKVGDRDLADFRIDDEGKVVVSSPSTTPRGSRKEKQGGSKMVKYKKKLIPIINRFSSNLKRAVSEKDLLKVLDFSVLDGPITVSPCDSAKGSPAPTPRRGVNGLRQCDSLENVCDSSRSDLVENGLAAQPAAATAISLPHIHQLSDYEEDHPDGEPAASGDLSSPHDPPSPECNNDNDLIVTAKRADRSKKTKLRRRRAYYRAHKDGRSKSLTHIDSLGEPGMLVRGESDMDTRGGDSGTDKLGVPEDFSSRRRKLSLANKVSSSEYVVVVLECFSETREEFIPAARGTTLREALERRDIEVSGVQVFADGSRAPLPITTDTYILGGKTVRVRAKDEGGRSPVRSRSAGAGGQPSRKTSGSYKSGQSRFFRVSQDESLLGDDRGNGGGGGGGSGGGGGGAPSSQEGSLKGAKPNKSNNRWSIFPSNAKDAKMDLLVQQLDHYSKHGIPKQPHLLACHGSELDAEEVVFEEGLRDHLSSGKLTDRQEQQQSAIWELVETEVTYIHMLKVITDLFLACLCNLQNESLLYEIDTDKLFSNIQEIYAANLKFWKEHILVMLENSCQAKEPLDPTILYDAFFRFDEIFHPYTRYCLEQSNCQLYCKEKYHENECYKMYLAWCETQKECNRLRLVDILVHPMQRLTKYSLLLKAILKKTDLEDHKIRLVEMIEHVECFVSNVNSALRHRHEQDRLREIINRIESYDAVESRDDELERAVRNHSDLNLTQPMPGCPEHLSRHLLHHGDLKLRDAHTSKMDVHVFLFTDLLLITKVTQRKAEKVKVVRPPYLVARLVLVELKDSSSLGFVYLNEWHVAVAAFTLQCHDVRALRTWHETLKRAQGQYREAQQAQDILYDPEEEFPVGAQLAPRSPRPGSSRASRVSSLMHSHSGSVDLNEPSFASSTQHPPSVDLSDVRASSASSDDSVPGRNSEIQRSRSLEGQACHQQATSPRPERRPLLSKTPNTLSVTPPYTTGQSLPNLTVDSPHSLRVPGSNHKQLSPSQRGVSYPPPSPRTLRRSAPVPQSRNPPLMKTRHVTSTIGSPQANENQTLDPNADPDDQSRGQRRISRTERLDNRRYHTAGAIDDIKKQDTKDAAIHKRLSWNYGQGPPPGSRELSTENSSSRLSRHRTANKSISCESMHSSSGVSSTSSLHRSMGSELEALEHIDDNELRADSEGTIVDLTVSECTSLKISPHISTTYISHDSEITLGGCSQYITQPMDSHEAGETCTTPGAVKIDVSKVENGSSSVQITVTEGTASPSTTASTNPFLEDSTQMSATPKESLFRMREILLNDASVEASDV